MMRPTELIVLYDGDCGLCNRSARWLANRDQEGRLLMAPNAGVTARIAGEPPGGEDAGIVVWDGAHRLVGVPAIARALRELRGAWPLAGRLIGALPRWVTHPVYAAVAKRRGRSGPACALPDAGDQRWLD
jgi:predicted DCC family thiol-disulfide oxidoreductase YuxK